MYFSVCNNGVTKIDQDRAPYYTCAAPWNARNSKCLLFPQCEGRFQICRKLNWYFFQAMMSLAMILQPVQMRPHAVKPRRAAGLAVLCQRYNFGCHFLFSPNFDFKGVADALMLLFWSCRSQAVCCEDFIHCCPKGKKCNLPAQTCDDDASSVPWFKKEPAFPRQGVQVRDVTCDSTHNCPDGTTCCKTKTEEWACCPLPEVNTPRRNMHTLIVVAVTTHAKYPVLVSNKQMLAEARNVKLTTFWGFSLEQTYEMLYCCTLF